MAVASPISLKGVCDACKVCQQLRQHLSDSHCCDLASEVDVAARAATACCLHREKQHLPTSCTDMHKLCNVVGRFSLFQAEGPSHLKLASAASPCSPLPHWPLNRAQPPIGSTCARTVTPCWVRGTGTGPWVPLREVSAASSWAEGWALQETVMSNCCCDTASPIACKHCRSSGFKAALGQPEMPLTRSLLQRLPSGAARVPRARGSWLHACGHMRLPGRGSSTTRPMMRLAKLKQAWTVSNSGALARVRDAVPCQLGRGCPGAGAVTNDVHEFS